jgi:hypothetical protein
LKFFARSRLANPKEEIEDVDSKSIGIGGIADDLIIGAAVGHGSHRISIAVVDY